MARQKQSARKGVTQLERENAELRSAVETQAQAQKATIAQLAAVLPSKHISAAELMVGVRNICDNTVGIRSPFPSERDLQLNADVDPSDPGRFGIVSYAWWQQLRKSKWVGEGYIMRDDSVLVGTSYGTAPADRPQDLAAGAAKHAIPDPDAWVNSFGSEADLREALDAITSEITLRRLRRMVDVKVAELQKKFADKANPAKAAVRALPALYQMLDQVITMRLEQDEEE